MNEKNCNAKITAQAELISQIISHREGTKIEEIIRKEETSESSNRDKVVKICKIILSYVGSDAELISAVFEYLDLTDDLFELWNDKTIREFAVTEVINAFAKSRAKSAFSAPFVTVNSKGVRTIVPKNLVDYLIEKYDFINVRSKNDSKSRLFIYNNGVYRRVNEEDFKAITAEELSRCNPKFYTTKLLKETYELLRVSIPITDEECLNDHHNLINYQNGLLRIDGNSENLLPHSKSIYSTIQIPCNWSTTEYQTPTFDRFINDLSAGKPDVAEFLLQFIALTISNIPGYKTKAALFLIGPGNTGKSVYRSVIEEIIGSDNCISIGLEDLETRFAIASIANKRFIGSSEISTRQINELSNFKKITGGDMVFADEKFEPAFHFKYNGTMCVCGNFLPIITGDTGKWVFERMLIVRCNNVIPEDHRDPDLLIKIADEREGIVHKLVKSLQKFISNGYKFDIPKSVLEERERYLIANNSAGAFLDTFTKPWGAENKRDSVSTAGNIYKAYKYWCGDVKNITPMTSVVFRNEVMKRYNAFGDSLVVTHINGHAYYKDFMLNESGIKLYSESLDQNT